MNPKGLKSTSSLIVIGARVAESGPNTFTQGQIDLQLNPLDNEVFVVQAIDLNCSPPDAQAGANSDTTCAITTTSQTSMPSFNSSNLLSKKELAIRAAGFADGGVSFDTGTSETPPSTLGYIGIISTNDFFIQVEGGGNGVTKTAAAKVYGYRARADASVYAALVQSEVLSA